MRLPPATLDQIANRVGVSRGTVSRVLNGKNKENRPAIARRSSEIRQVASELDYRPNVAARSIFSGKFNAVAFVTCGDLGKDWYPLSGLHGIHSTLESMGMRFMYTELPTDKIVNPALVPQLFREASVDGLIVNLVPLFAEEIVDYFESQPLPCVWLNKKREFRSIYPDEISGAKFAVNWLVDRGHQRIGYFSRYFGSKPHYSVSDRLIGFQQAMKAANLPGDCYFNSLTDSDAEGCSLLDRAGRFLRTFPDLDAVIGYEVEDTVCLATVARQIGLSQPDQLEIIGYSEREIRSITGLPIPTLIVPFKEVGRLAAKMMAGILKSHDRNLPSIAVPYASIQS